MGWFENCYKGKLHINPSPLQV